MNFEILKDFTSVNTLINEANRLGLNLRAIGYKNLIDRIKNGGTIINLSDYGYSNGTHWTAIWRSGKNYFYFDSYGFRAPTDIEKLIIEQGASHYYFNSAHIQPINDGGCGNYVIQFLEWMQKRTDLDLKKRFSSFISLFQKDLKKLKLNRDIVTEMAFHDL